MNQYTQARWNGKLVSGGAKEVMSFADSRYSPAAGSNYLWKDAPLLAFLCNQMRAKRIRFDGNDYRVGTTQDGWVQTLVGTTPTIARSAAGLLLTTSGTENDGINLQHCDGMFSADPTKDIWAEFYLIPGTDATQVNWLCGLAVTDTTLLESSGSANLSADSICFIKDDGDDNIDCVTRAGSTETRTDSGIDVAASTPVRVGFHVIGTSRVDFYVNDVLKAQHSTNISLEAMRLSVAFLTGETGANSMHVAGDIFQPY